MGKYSKLYDILYEGHPRWYCDTLSEKDIEKRAHLYKQEYSGVVADSVSKMEKTHTPKIYFEYLELAEKYIDGALIVSKYFPKLFSDVMKVKEDFDVNKEPRTLAFIDRVIRFGGNEAAKEVLKYKRKLTKNEIFYISKKTAQ